MNESAYIDRIAEMLGACGVTVRLHAHEIHYGGQYRPLTNEVLLNFPHARQALMSLAHEAGHWVGYLLHGVSRNLEREQYQRERQAYVYGWRVLVFVGANALITREEWIDDCTTSHVYFRAAEAGLLDH